MGALAGIHFGGPGDRSRGLAGKAVLSNVLAGLENLGSLGIAGRTKFFWVTNCPAYAAPC